MKQGVKKWLILFVGLGVPLLVFLFLKMAGRNEFAIPVMFETEMPQVPQCEPVTLPYRLPESWSNSAANVIVFDMKRPAFDKLENQLTEELGTKLTMQHAGSLEVDSTVVANWRSCLFFLPPTRQSALYDSLGQIRGQYDLTSREEVDRLRVELKILLKQY